MKLEFVAKNGRDGSNPAANTGRFLNCYIEPLGGRAGYQIRSVPGMAEVASLGRAFMRDMMVYDGELVTLCGGTLTSISDSGSKTDLGTIGDSEDSGLSQNTGYITAVSAGGYYTWDGTTLATVVPGALTEVSSVAYLGGYTVVSERGGRRIQWSALVDPTTFSGLDFASAEITDEPIMRLVAMKDMLFVFKASSMELWQVTGLPGPNALQRIPGAHSETGLRSYGLVSTMPNGLAFVGNDGRVYVFGAPAPISTPPVEVAIERYNPQRVFFYESRGHGFICIAFRGAPAWCYDVATGEWHERAEAGAPWTARASERMDGVWYVGDDLGRVSTLSAACYDHGLPLVRTITSMPVENSAPFRVARLELFPRVGDDAQDGRYSVLDDGEVAPTVPPRFLGYGIGDRRNAGISIQTSRDGRTWGPEIVRDVGAPGEYTRRVVFRNLGRFAHLGAFKINISAGSDIPLLSAAEVQIA